jgi:hypothetical protein
MFLPFSLYLRGTFRGYKPVTYNLSALGSLLLVGPLNVELKMKDP